MLKIGICDDDEQFLIQLEKYVLAYAHQYGIPISIYKFFDAENLFDTIEEVGLFDILFLDIELQKETGIEIGNKLRADINNEIMQIVFVSANDTYALQLFDIRPMNFLVKPVTYEKVAYVMKEYARLFPDTSQYFSYNIRKMEHRISFDCILYFQSQGKRIQMVTQDRIEVFYGKIADILPQLEGHGFCTVHKSFVVNTKYITKYIGDYIIMANNEEIPVSHSMKANIIEYFERNLF